MAGNDLRRTEDVPAFIMAGNGPLSEKAEVAKPGYHQEIRAGRRQHTKKAEERFASQMYLMKHFATEARDEVSTEDEIRDLENLTAVFRGMILEMLNTRVYREPPREKLVEELRFWVELARDSKALRTFIRNMFFLLGSRGIQFLLFDALVDNLLLPAAS